MILSIILGGKMPLNQLVLAMKNAKVYDSVSLQN